MENFAHCMIVHVQYANMAFPTHLADGATFDAASIKLLLPHACIHMCVHLNTSVTLHCFALEMKNTFTRQYCMNKIIICIMLENQIAIFVMVTAQLTLAGIIDIIKHSIAKESCSGLMNALICWFIALYYHLMASQLYGIRQEFVGLLYIHTHGIAAVAICSHFCVFVIS